MPSFHVKEKAFLQNYHHTVKFHVLEAQKDKGTSKKPSLDNNLVIYSDNLNARKALLPTHAGKVKCNLSRCSHWKIQSLVYPFFK